MKKLRLLVSAYACNPRSTEASFPGEAILGWNIVRQLGRFADVTVLTRSYNRENIEEALRQEGVENIFPHYLSLPSSLSFLLRHYLGFSLYYLFWQVKAYFYARRLVKQDAFDAFHQVTFANDWMPSFIGGYLPLPFIWGPIGGAHRAPEGLLPELGPRFRRKEKVREAGKVFWRKTPFRKRGLRRACRILVCNRETEQAMAKLKDKVRFFPVNGIAAEEQALCDIQDSPAKGDFRILFAGRLDPIKGLKLGVRAFGLFVKNHPEATFEIVGSGEAEEEVRELTRRLGLEERIRMTPWLERADLIEHLRSCDVLLFPSFRDGGGAVIVEAMACGKPVVCLDTGGPGFHVRESWGIKVPPRDPTSVVVDLAEALEILYDDPDLRAKLGEAAQERVRSFYLWDRLGDRLHDIYKEALAEVAERGGEFR